MAMFDLIFPKHWSTLKKLIWLKAAALSSAVVKTVTDAIVHIKDALAGPAQNVTIAIEPVQDLHGYESPWPDGGSPNLYNGSNYTLAAHQYIKGSSPYDVAYWADTTNRSIIMPCVSSSKYFVTSGAKGTMRVGSFKTSPAAGSTPTVFATATSSSDPVGLEITTGANDGYLFIQFFIDGDVTSYGSTLENSLNGFVLKKDSNICPITGWTGANVYRAALYGLGPLENYGLTDNGDVNAVDTYEHSNYIDLTGVNSASISFKGGAPGGWVYRVCGYDTNKAFVELIDQKTLTGGNYSYEYNVTNYSFLRVSLVKDCENVVFTTEKTTIPITFPTPPGTVYGGTLDVTNGVLTVTHGYVDLGTRTWTRNTAGIYPYFNSAYFDEAARPASISLKCSAYKAIANINGTSFRASAHNGEICIDRQSARPAIMIQDSTYSDADTFKTALSGVQLVYALATPQTYQLTPQEIQLLAGENNLWADTGNTTLTYLADGRASDVDALGILLAGRYVNHGAADEATDAEALDILLGGTK